MSGASKFAQPGRALSPHATPLPRLPQRVLFCCMLWSVLQSQLGMCVWRGKGALDMHVRRFFCALPRRLHPPCCACVLLWLPRAASHWAPPLVPTKQAAEPTPRP